MQSSFPVDLPLPRTLSDWQHTLHTLREQLHGVPRPGRWCVRGIKAGARPFLAFSLLKESQRPALIVAPSTKAAERFSEDLTFLFGEEDCPSPFTRRVHFLPAWDVVPFEDLSPPPDLLAARIEGLYHLRQDRNPIVVTTPEALTQKVPPLTEFGGRYVYLVEAEQIDRDKLIEQLVDWGYRSVSLVEDRGDFGARGGIVDVFPPAHTRPIRLHLDGDTIESMHEFDPISQRLVDPSPELLILPVREFGLQTIGTREVLRAVESRALELEISRQERNLILDGLASGLLFPGVEFCLPYFYGKLESVFDYLPVETLVWIDDPGGVDASLERAAMEVERRAAQRGAEHRFHPPPHSLFLTSSEWRSALARHTTIELEQLDVIGGTDDASRLGLRSFSTADLRIRRAHQRREVTFAPVAEQIRSWCGEGYQVLDDADTVSRAAGHARPTAPSHPRPLPRGLSPSGRETHRDYGRRPIWGRASARGAPCFGRTVAQEPERTQTARLRRSP
jgi:transcription-repair coupling factor (superfamily II helicase)